VWDAKEHDGAEGEEVPMEARQNPVDWTHEAPCTNGQNPGNVACQSPERTAVDAVHVERIVQVSHAQCPLKHGKNPE
jgi:hypothetical protein